MLEITVKKFLGDARRPKENDFSLDLSFVAENGITALVGASGSGKTTTLRLIAGIMTPDAGRIAAGSQVYFDDALGINAPIRDRRVGFVFQDYALFPHFTAAQNIAYGIRDKRPGARAELTAAMLALFHIEHLGRRLPREMSGGERQRVALARALASDPAVVLLDEPLSAVDFETRTRLLDEIKTAQAQTRVPFIYVTHNENEIEQLGAHAVRLEMGRIAGGG